MLTGMAILALTGCQNNKKNSSVAKQNGVGQVKKTNHSNTNNGGKFGHNASASTALWDTNKQDKLDDFFDDWADSMNQEYDKKAEILLEQIEWSDAACVGAAAGMSVATGYDMAYHSDKYFKK